MAYIKNITPLRAYLQQKDVYLPDKLLAYDHRTDERSESANSRFEEVSLTMMPNTPKFKTWRK
jgi:hypothetical protein